MNIKKNNIQGCEIGLCGCERNIETGSCENDNKTSDSIKEINMASQAAIVFSRSLIYKTVVLERCNMLGTLIVYDY